MKGSLHSAGRGALQNVVALRACLRICPPHAQSPSALFLIATLQALFGDSLHADGNGTLTFLDYLKAVNKRMPGRAAAAAGKDAAKSRGR